MEAQPTAAVFGSYRLVELLSCTASARVYRAVDTRHDGRSVALKLFAAQLSRDPGFRDRFRRDAGLLSALRDPHVVRVHTYGELDGTAYLDMRLISGRSLADVRRAGFVDAGRAASITAQLAEAIDAVRAGGLGVRAVDEADVLVSEADFVQVVGLGLGRLSAGPPVVAADVVGPPRRRRRRWWRAAVAAVAVLLAGTITLAVARTDPVALPPGAVAILAGGDGATSLATAVLDGRPVLVGVVEGRVRSWDLATGQLVGATLDGSAGLVATAVLGGQPVAVQRDTDQVVRVRQLSDGRTAAGPIGDPETHPSSTIMDRPRSIEPGELAGTPVVIMAEPADPATFDTDPRLGYRVRSVRDGTPVGPLVTVPGTSFRVREPFAAPRAISVDGAPAVVAATDAREIRVFDMRTGAPVGTPGRTPADINVLRVGERDGAPVAVVGCADNTVRTIDLRTGVQAGPVMAGHTAAVGNLLVVPTGERTVVASVANGGEVRFWDLASGAQLGSALRDHPVGVWLLASAQLDGRPVLAASDFADDGSGVTTVWDLAALMGEATS